MFLSFVTIFSLWSCTKLRSPFIQFAFLLPKMKYASSQRIVLFRLPVTCVIVITLIDLYSQENWGVVQRLVSLAQLCNKPVQCTWLRSTMIRLFMNWWRTDDPGLQCLFAVAWSSCQFRNRRYISQSQPLYLHWSPFHGIYTLLFPLS